MNFGPYHGKKTIFHSPEIPSGLNARGLHFVTGRKLAKPLLDALPIFVGSDLGQPQFAPKLLLALPMFSGLGFDRVRSMGETLALLVIHACDVLFDVGTQSGNGCPQKPEHRHQYRYRQTEN